MKTYIKSTIFLLLIFFTNKNMAEDLNISFINYVKLQSSNYGITLLDACLFNKEIYLLVRTNTSHWLTNPSLMKIQTDGTIVNYDIAEDNNTFSEVLFLHRNDSLRLIQCTKTREDSSVFNVITIENNELVKNNIDSAEYNNLRGSITPARSNHRSDFIKNFNSDSIIVYRSFSISDLVAVVLTKTRPGTIELPPYLIYAEAEENIIVAFYKESNSQMIYPLNFFDPDSHEYFIKNEKELYLDVKYRALNINTKDISTTKLLLSETESFDKVKVYNLNFHDYSILQYKIDKNIKPGGYFLKLSNQKISSQLYNKNYIYLQNDFYSFYLKKKNIYMNLIFIIGCCFISYWIVKYFHDGDLQEDNIFKNLSNVWQIIIETLLLGYFLGYGIITKLIELIISIFKN